MMVKHDDMLALVRELADLERAGWAPRLRALRASGAPLNEGGDSDDGEKPVEKTVPQSRLTQEIDKTKAAKAEADAAAKERDELRAKLEARENESLPEVERLTKELDRERKAREKAEQARDQAQLELRDSERAGWVTRAAKDFDDPADALAFIQLDDIADEKAAERAVSDLGKAKPRLLKEQPDPQLPGRVLENGQPAAKDSTDASSVAPGLGTLREAYAAGDQ